MELNESGWYKTPRVMKGLPFLRHITETRKCGNCMIVDFGRVIDVIDWRYLEADAENHDPICFLGSGVGENIFVADITEWEFVQYRPNTAWKAIHMDKSNTEGINIYTFERTYKEEIRVNLKPVLIQYRNTFWYIMNIVPMFVKDGMVWDIFLKDRKYDSMVKVTVDDRQTFGYSALSKTYYFEASVPEVKQYTGDYEVDVTKPDGQKVRILRMSNGEPFDENKWYTVAVNSYRANGGGELLTKGAGIPRDSLKSRIIWESPKDQRHYLMEEIKKAGVMNPQPNHNWKFIPETWTIPAAARDRKLLFKE